MELPKIFLIGDNTDFQEDISINTLRLSEIYNQS
jgi:hypothetical protein